MVKWLATLFSQLDSLKPFPSTAQKDDTGSGALRNKLYTIESQSKSSWMSSGGKRAPHLEGLGKASCAAGSWLRDGLEGTNISSDSREKQGRKQAPTDATHARNSTHMLSPTQKALQGSLMILILYVFCNLPPPTPKQEFTPSWSQLHSLLEKKLEKPFRIKL